MCVCGLQVKALSNPNRFSKFIESRELLTSDKPFHFSSSSSSSILYICVVSMIHFVYCVSVSIFFGFIFVCASVITIKNESEILSLRNELNIYVIWNNNLMANFRVGSSLLLHILWFHIFVYFLFVCLFWMGQFFASCSVSISWRREKKNLLLFYAFLCVFLFGKCEIRLQGHSQSAQRARKL